MCGIVGIINGNFKLLPSMLKLTNHRGPDGSGIIELENVAFGHNRLAIIDLDKKANQPFKYYSANNKYYIVVFNGEIYNYIEIKNELIKVGFNFFTNSDTEVLCAAYSYWGENCVLKFNGMWSFVIFDKVKNSLFISRDRFGVKPFYYSTINNSFIFSSEIKSIIYYFKNSNIPLKIDSNALNLYFSLGYVPSPFSIFININKLESSHNLIYDISDGTLKKNKYYSPFTSVDKMNKLDSKLYFFSLFNDSIKLRLRSDVDVGAFLSGGIDSTSVVKFMSDFSDKNKFHTFSIGFQNKYDETKYIKIAENKIKIKNHHHKYFYSEDFLTYHSLYFDCYDEPFADYSGFSSLMVSELGKEFSTVILSGDGGDEVFGGYNLYNIGLYIQYISILPKFVLNSLVRQLKKLPSSNNLNRIIDAFELAKYPKNEFISSYRNFERFNPTILKNWSENKLLECLVESDNYLPTALTKFDQIYNTLPDKYLTKVDRSSMRFGIEVRSPFLDYRIVEFGNSLPHDWKVSLFNNKIFLKEALKSKIPKEILQRPKQGFTPPFVDWISNSFDVDKFKLDFLYELSTELVFFYKNKVFLDMNNQFNKEYIIRLYIFNKWYKRWIGN